MIVRALIEGKTDPAWSRSGDLDGFGNPDLAERDMEVRAYPVISGLIERVLIDGPFRCFAFTGEAAGCGGQLDWTRNIHR